MTRKNLLTGLSVLALATAIAPAIAAHTAPATTPDKPVMKHDAAMQAKAKPKKSTVAQPVEVEMKTAFGRPEIEVMIDGKGPFKFLVDSGAGSTVINSDLAEELGLKVVGATAIGDPINPEAIQAKIVAVPSLEIGGAKFEDFQAASWNHQDILKGKGDDLPRGVIGFPTFADVLLTFDYVDGKLRIANGELPKADGKTVLAYEAPMGIPELTLKIGGVDVATHLDTGSGGFLSVPKKYQDQLKFAGPLEEVGRARTVNTEMILKGAELAGNAAIGQFVYEKPFVLVSDELPMGNLGSRALAPFAITFDQHAKSVQFQQKAPLVADRPQREVRVAGAPSASNAAATGPPASGMRFASHGDGDLEVYSVEPGSPAAKAGIKAGDKVLEINGTALSALADDARRTATRTSPLKLKLESEGVTREVVVVFP
jgi:predicted aspartyl protease